MTWSPGTAPVTASGLPGTLLGTHTTSSAISSTTETGSVRDPCEVETVAAPPAVRPQAVAVAGLTRTSLEDSSVKSGGVAHEFTRAVEHQARGGGGEGCRHGTTDSTGGSCLQEVSYLRAGGNLQAGPHRLRDGSEDAAV